MGVVLVLGLCGGGWVWGVRGKGPRGTPSTLASCIFETSMLRNQEQARSSWGRAASRLCSEQPLQLLRRQPALLTPPGRQA